jgi:hypothetical protein
MKDLLAILLMMLYNLTILGGTVYLVAERDWSPWWFVLSAMLMLSKTKDEK